MGLKAREGKRGQERARRTEGKEDGGQGGRRIKRVSLTDRGFAKTSPKMLLVQSYTPLLNRTRNLHCIIIIQLLTPNLGRTFPILCHGRHRQLQSTNVRLRIIRCTVVPTIPTRMRPTSKQWPRLTTTFQKTNRLILLLQKPPTASAA